MLILNKPDRSRPRKRQPRPTIIRISGENWGAISSAKEYADYHLQLQFKWGSLQWAQKKNKKRDNGLLYHSVGPYGADYGAWMRSQEFQVEEGNTGDYWGVQAATRSSTGRSGSNHCRRCPPDTINDIPCFSHPEHPAALWRTHAPHGLVIQPGRHAGALLLL